MRYSEKWPQYAKWWDAMVIKPARVTEFEKLAQFAIDHKDQYLAISNKTGVEWYHIALLHRREGDGNFRTYLGNGQSLAHRTTEVPVGRGPFTGPNAFFDGALDALKIDGLSSVIDWRLEKMLYYCEVFNGGGYSRRGIPSPYIWGGTNIQVVGKYVSDRKWGNVWDTQPGCAPILWTIAKLDPTVKFVREA